jgi:hypothetical protein
MQFKNLLPTFLILIATLPGIALAHRHGNPGPTCGAPFCNKRAIMYSSMMQRSATATSGEDTTTIAMVGNEAQPTEAA